MEVQIIEDDDPEEMENDDAPIDTQRSSSYMDDPVQDSSQFPSHLLTGNAANDDGFAPEYLLATEERFPEHTIPFSQRIGPTENREEILNNDDDQQQIITIIQDPVACNLGTKDCVPKEMLKRFVINAEGIHPPIRSFGALITTTEGEINRGNEEANLKLDQAGHQHVVIFSTSASDVTSQAAGGDSEKLTIALVQDEESTFPEMIDACAGGSGSQQINLAGQSKDMPIELDMTFAVAAELEDPDGQIVMREITTQTEEQKKRHPRKRRTKYGLEKRRKTQEENAHGDVDGDDLKPFRCTKCNLKFTNQETCDVHIQCHVPMHKVYQCCFCDYSDTKWTKMHQHLFKHGIAKPHKCTQCSFSCRSRSDLTAHMAVHSNTKEFTCSKCFRLFKHKRNLVAHLRTCPGLDERGQPQQLGPTEKYLCSVCNQKLSSKKNLDKHMEIHMNYKPYICDKCGHATRLKESLIMHKRLHTGEKPFKCDFCDYATPDKSSLRRHKRTHTNDKPYKCQFCSYSCIQKHCLDTHIRRKHTGEQFVCGLCHYATHDRYGLNQHFKRHQNADGTIVHEIEIVDEAKRSQRLSNLVPPSTSTTYISLPSGAVLKSTNNGKNTIIEESQKKLSDNTVPIRLPMPAKLPLQDTETGASKDSGESEARGADGAKEEVAVELGQLEASLLEQIQQPGDVIFVQPTGEIVIRRQDGHLLVIQRQDIEEEDEQPEGQAETNTPEYLAAIPPSEISGAIEQEEKRSFESTEVDEGKEISQPNVGDG